MGNLPTIFESYIYPLLIENFMPREEEEATPLISTEVVTPRESLIEVREISI